MVKNIIGFSGGFVLWVLVVALGFLYLYNSQTMNLTSPTLASSRSGIADNIWFPQTSTESAILDKNAPDVTSQAAFFVETQTGQILYEKNIHEQLPIASLTKIMTSIIALEHKNLNDEMIVSERAANYEPDKMFLKSGERLTLQELLSGMFLVSGNDAAEVLAEDSLDEHSNFSLTQNGEQMRTKFIDLMNIKANQLGMVKTKFINPTGLQEDNVRQYSTAYDVVLMSRYVIRKWPQVLNIASQPYVYIPRTEEHQDYEMYSGINLLTTYKGVLGLKTGYTPEAGLTLVTIARRDGYEVIGVLLGSTSRREDAKELLDYSFKKLGVKV